MDAAIEIDLQKSGIKQEGIPAHIAFIMDGNGRWAKKRLMPRQIGHKEGHYTLKRLVTYCGKIGVKYVSAYTFSTENWQRPQKEVSFLLKYLKEVILTEVDEMKEEGVRIRFMGDLSAFDSDILNVIQKAEEKTKDCDVIQLNIMLNYGSRQEILQATNRLIEKGTPITEGDFSEALYTSGCPDPDILIRTSGEIRMSNFLLWQCAYTEFFFVKDFWPDFNEQRLLDVIKEYQQRDRRYGGLSE